MPTLSPALSLTLSPASTTSDNSNHRPFAGGLLRLEPVLPRWPASQRGDGGQPGQQAVDGRFEDSAAMLVIPVAATPTGGRSFAESAGRHEHRPHIFLALPQRSFRDWRNGKCRDHALPLPFRAAFLDENRAEKTIGTSATIGVDNQLGLVLWEQFRRVAVWLIATPASQETHWGKPRPRGGVFLSAAARQCDWL